jgi:hypothetical protein
MLIPALAALGGGILNAWSQGSQRSSLNKRLDSMMQEYRKAMLDPSEIEGKVRRSNSIFNSAVENTLNKTAYQTRGVLNSGTAKAAAIAGIEGQRAQVTSSIYDNAERYNLDILNRIGSLETSKATGDPVGDFVGGAVQGGIAGAQISYLMKPDATVPETQPEALKENPSSILGSLLKALTIEDEDAILPDEEMGPEDIILDDLPLSSNGKRRKKTIPGPNSADEISPSNWNGSWPNLFDLGDTSSVNYYGSSYRAPKYNSPFTKRAWSL